MTEPPAHENGRTRPAWPGESSLCPPTAQRESVSREMLGQARPWPASRFFILKAFAQPLFGTGKAFTELSLQILANALESIRADKFGVRQNSTSRRRITPSKNRGEI